MATLARMHVELIARTDAFLRDMDKAQAKIKKTASGFVEAGKAIAAGWVVREIIKNTAEAEAAFAQLTAAVKSTGGAAGFSAEQLREQAGAMQQVSTFSDEAVEHMQAVLLTFTKVRGDNFTRASAAIADMATRMGTDLKSAALQVGKALQDPVKGAAALARAGVQLSESQKAAIADLVKLGDVAGAQRVILKELEVQFGGSAAAARNTLGGALTAVKNAFGDALEAGSEFSGGLTGAFNAIAQAIPKIRKVFDDFLKGFQIVCLDLSIAWADFTSSTIRRIGHLLVKIGEFSKLLGNVVPPLKLLAAPAVAAGQKILADHINETTEALKIYREEQVKIILGLDKQTKSTDKGIVSATAFGDVMETNVRTAKEWAKLLKEIEDDDLVGSSQESAGGLGLLTLPTVEELKPALGEIRREIKKTWMDSARDFVTSFVDGLHTIRDRLTGLLQGVFGGQLANVFATAIGTALGPILGNVMSSIASKIGEWASDLVRALDFSGSGRGTPAPGFVLVAFGPGGPVYAPDPNATGGGQTLGTGESNPFNKSGKVPGDSGNVERLQTITSRAATATIEQENRLIGIQSTALVVLRQSRDLLARLASGGVPVISRMDGDANRSRLVGGDALVPA